MEVVVRGTELDYHNNWNFEFFTMVSSVNFGRAKLTVADFLRSSLTFVTFFSPFYWVAK